MPSTPHHPAPTITTLPSPKTDPRFLQFVLHHTPTYLANGLRRCLLADLKAPGIANAYAHKRHNRTRLGAPTADVTDTDGSTVSAAGSGIHIHTNTGRINNEMLRLRLALLPIGLDPAMFHTPDGGKLILRLNKKCPADAEEPVAVTSDDVVLVKLGGDEAVDMDVDAGVDPAASGAAASDPSHTSDQPRPVTDMSPYLLPEATQLIPTDPVVDRLLRDMDNHKNKKNNQKGTATVPRGILITRLYPEESLAVDVYPGIGCSRDFAGFSPLHTCTYQQLEPSSTSSSSFSTSHPSHHDFQFTIQSLGAYTPHTLVREGLQQLQRKVSWFREQLRPNTIVLDFGSTAYPSLHTVLSSSTRTCWVKWSDVDFLTRLRAPEAFYRRHCHDVLAVTTEDDAPLRTTAYKPSERVPSVDSEDVVESTDETRHVLALHQPDYATNGVYEYDSTSRTYTRVPQAHATFLIAKDGRTQRAKVFTQAELVAVHDTCCVLRFGEVVTPTIMEHIRTHIEGLVCAEAAPTHCALSTPPPAAALGYRITAAGEGGWYTRVEAEQSRAELFVFGENDDHHGTQHQQHSTQAVIRGLPNALGVRTCTRSGEGYRDGDYEANTKKIDEDFSAIEAKFEAGRYQCVVFPGDGLGTGVASLPDHAPHTYAYLMQRLGECKASLSSVTSARLETDGGNVGGEGAATTADATTATTTATTEPSIPLSAPRFVRPDIITNVSDNGHIFTLIVSEEDHTLGNLVQGWVYDRFLRTDGHTLPAAAKTNTTTEHLNRHHLLAFAYKQPLPSERTIVFRAEFGKGLGEKGEKGDKGDKGAKGYKEAFGEMMGEWVEGVERMVGGVVDEWE